jgi:hypothetical protein
VISSIILSCIAKYQVDLFGSKQEKSHEYFFTCWMSRSDACGAYSATAVPIFIRWLVITVNRNNHTLFVQ